MPNGHGRSTLHESIQPSTVLARARFSTCFSAARFRLTSPAGCCAETVAAVAAVAIATRAEALLGLAARGDSCSARAADAATDTAAFSIAAATASSGAETTWAGNNAERTSGFENLHQVRPVLSGERFVLSIWYSLGSI